MSWLVYSIAGQRTLESKDPLRTAISRLNKDISRHEAMPIDLIYTRLSEAYRCFIGRHELVQRRLAKSAAKALAKAPYATISADVTSRSAYQKTSVNAMPSSACKAAVQHLPEAGSFIAYLNEPLVGEGTEVAKPLGLIKRAPQTQTPKTRSG